MIICKKNLYWWHILININLCKFIIYKELKYAFFYISLYFSSFDSCKEICLFLV